jgi:lipopolysaccharide export system permease protein
MRAVGLGYNRLLRVPYLITLALMAVNLLVVGYLQPYARYYYEQLQFDLRSGALGASIKVGEFTTLKDRMALRIEQSRDEGRQLIGIFARIANAKGQVLSISAREGQFMALKNNPDTIILRLTDGQIIQANPGESPRVLAFSRHDLPIDLPAIEQFRERGKDREYVLPELLRIGWGDRVPRAEQLASRANLNFRLVEVAIMIFLPLLAVALAVPPKRSTSSLGVFVSIVMVTVYHKVCEYGQGVAAAGRADPTLVQWGPFVVFALIILWMYWRIAYVPGGQPIGALERSAQVIGKRLRTLLGRRAPAGA